MKTNNNQTGQAQLELAVLKAANEDGISPVVRESTAPVRKQAWSPHEVWRTRVKASPKAPRSKPAPLQ